MDYLMFPDIDSVKDESLGSRCQLWHLWQSELNWGDMDELSDQILPFNSRHG
jgi:hypothetical protein